jgi:hypothetical protein
VILLGHRTHLEVKTKGENSRSGPTWLYGVEEGLGAGGEGLLEGGVALGVEHVHGQSPGVQSDATVEFVWLVVASPRGLRGSGQEARHFK